MLGPASMLHIEDVERFLFIVGAPRCGTTTMARWLQFHPQILFPFVKEPHFFLQYDLRGLDDAELRRRVEHDFLDHYFSQPKPGQTVGADGSVSYLYAPEQLEPVLELWPDSRFVVGVRDPLTLLPSLHKRLIFTGDENIRSFEDAWAAVPDRAAGRRIPWSTIDPRFLRYDEAARYGTYVERLFNAVGKERCLVMVFDDLLADPVDQHRRLLEFADLKQVAPPEFKREREGKGVRYLLLQQLLKRPPEISCPIWRRSVSRVASTRKPARKRAKPSLALVPSQFESASSAGTGRRGQIPVPLRVQREIQAHFQGEVDRLGELIGRDLSHWLQPREGSERSK